MYMTFKHFLNYSLKGHLHSRMFLDLNSVFNSVLGVNALLQSRTWVDPLFMRRKKYNKCCVHHTNGFSEAKGKPLRQPGALVSGGQNNLGYFQPSNLKFLKALNKHQIGLASNSYWLQTIDLNLILRFGDNSNNSNWI